MNIDRDILPAGANPADYPVEELARERSTVSRFRVRLAHAARKIHRGVLQGNPRLRHRRIRMLHHIVDTCRTPQRMSVALNMPDRLGIVDRRERDMLKRTWQAMQLAAS